MKRREDSHVLHRKIAFLELLLYFSVTALMLQLQILYGQTKHLLEMKHSPSPDLSPLILNICGYEL